MTRFCFPDKCSHSSIRPRIGAGIRIRTGDLRFCGPLPSAPWLYPPSESKPVITPKSRFKKRLIRNRVVVDNCNGHSLKRISPPLLLQTIMNNQNLAPSFQRYSYPPPPPVFNGQSQYGTETSQVCVKCNSRSNVLSRTFKRAYVPPAAFLTVFLGILGGLLVLALIKVQHDITLPYCNSCWKNFKKANVLEGLSMFSFFVALVLGVALMINLGSGWAFWIPIIMSVIAIVAAQRYKRAIHPKFKKINRKEAIVATRAYGDIIFSKVTAATVRPGSSY
jgi:hypothetical protein